MIKYILYILALIISFSAFGQEEKKHIREGNKLYEEGKFDEAENSYNTALQKNNQSVKAEYNLGDALYKQKKFAEAAQQFQKVAEHTSDDKVKANAYHNIGNSLLQAEKYDESIKAYKEALK